MKMPQQMRGVSNEPNSNEDRRIGQYGPLALETDEPPTPPLLYGPPGQHGPRFQEKIVALGFDTL